MVAVPFVFERFQNLIGGINGRSESTDEFRDLDIGTRQQTPECSACNFTVVWNCKCGVMTWLCKNDVAAALSGDLPSKVLKAFHYFSWRQNRNIGHYIATSSSRV